MDLLQSPLVLAAVCAFFFWGAGAREARSGGPNHGPLWTLLSVLASMVTVFAFEGTLGRLLLAQVGLFLGIGVFRACRES